VLEIVTKAGLEWPIAGNATGHERAREHPQEQEQRGAQRRRRRNAGGPEASV
jgi:hypothetical protein